MCAAPDGAEDAAAIPAETAQNFDSGRFVTPGAVILWSTMSAAR
jgi:hypothetical protein